MRKLRSGRWPLPVELINSTLGTDLVPDAHITLKRNPIKHIQDRHPQQIEVIAGFFDRAAFAEPSYIGLKTDMERGIKRINLAYPINEFDRFKYIYLVATIRHGGKFVSIVTSFLLDENDVALRLAQGVFAPTADQRINDSEKPLSK
jgi:hypothetical protein